MKAIIIEDEKLSADMLASMLQKIDPLIEIVATMDSVRQSVEAFRNGLKADLIFLDIHLADGLGFDLFAEVTLDIPVIFTTAYSEYAIKAFEVNSVDYLLKPIGLDELRKAIEKFKKYKHTDKNSFMANISAAFEQMSKQYKSRFMVKLGSTIDSIKVKDILHFITHDGLTFLVIPNGKRYPVDYTLEQLESVISPEDFFRINRKVIVSIQQISKASSYFNGRLVITSPHLEGEVAIVSRERVNDFKEWMGGGGGPI